MCIVDIDMRYPCVSTTDQCPPKIVGQKHGRVRERRRKERHRQPTRIERRSDTLKMEMESASTTSSAHSQTRLKSSAEDLHLKSVSARLKSRMLAAADTRVSACASALLSPAPHWLATAASGNRQGLGLRRWRTSRCFVTHGQHAVPEVKFLSIRSVPQRAT